MGSVIMSFITYFVRFLLPIIAMIIALIISYSDILIFFQTNLIVNSIIIFALFIGVFYAFLKLYFLKREYQWMTYIQKIVLKNDIKEIQQALVIRPKLRYLSLTYRIFEQLIIAKSIVKLALNQDQSRMMVQALDERLGESKEIANYMVGLLVFLGLLGTFWGLLVTIGGVGDVVANVGVDSNNQAEAIASLKSGLEVPLSGMGSAFSSSLFGLGGSLILGYFSLQLGIAQNHFYYIVEEWLSSLTESHILSDNNIESDGSHHGLQYLIEATMPRLCDAIEKMTNTQKQQEQSHHQMHDYLLDIYHQLKDLTNVMQEQKEPSANKNDNDMRQLERHLRTMSNHIVSSNQENMQSLCEEIRTTNRLLSRVIGETEQQNS